MAASSGEGSWAGRSEDEASSLLVKCVTPNKDKEEDNSLAQREWHGKGSVRRPMARPKDSNQAKKDEFYPLMKEYVRYWPNPEGPAPTPEEVQQNTMAKWRRRRPPIEQKNEPEDISWNLAPTRPNPTNKPGKEIVISLGDDSSSSDEEVEGRGKEKGDEERKAKDKGDEERKPENTPMSKSEIMGNMRKKVMLYAESLYTLCDPNDEVVEPMENLSLAYEDYGMVPVVKGRPG